MNDTMTRDDIRFVSTCADWADSAHADMSFYRDGYDGWVAKISMSDARGTFSASVGMLPRNGKHGDVLPETPPAYEARIARALSHACAKARERRQKMPNSPRL